MSAASARAPSADIRSPAVQSVSPRTTAAKARRPPCWSGSRDRARRASSTARGASPRRREHQPRPASPCFGGQGLQPAEHRGHLAAAPCWPGANSDQSLREPELARRERVPYGLAQVPVLLVPTRGPEVQFARKPGVLVPEAAEQEVPEEVMVAVPSALVV